MPTSRELKVVRGVPVGFNTSSIAIRRSVVSDRLGLIEDVGMLVDVTLLYLSLLLPGHLRFDPIPLTSFRKHSASNSDPQLNDSTAFLTRMRDYLQKAQKSREYLVRYVSTHGSIALIRSIEGQQAIGRLILDLRSPATSRSERGRSIVAALSRWRTFEVSRYWPAFPLGLLCFLSPRFGSKVVLFVSQKARGIRLDWASDPSSHETGQLGYNEPSESFTQHPLGDLGCRWHLPCRFPRQLSNPKVNSPRRTAPQRLSVRQ